MNPLALLLLGVKPTSGNTTAPLPVQGGSADSGLDTVAFEDTLVQALESTQKEDGTQQAQNPDGPIQMLANPAAAIPLVNLLAPAVSTILPEPGNAPPLAVTAPEILPAPAKESRPIAMPFSQEEGTTSLTPVFSGPEAHANPAARLPETTPPKNDADPVPAEEMSLSAQAANGTQPETPAAVPSRQAHAEFNPATNHATRLAASVSPDDSPAPYQETPPAGRGRWAVAAAESARIITDEFVTQSQAPLDSTRGEVISSVQPVVPGDKAEGGEISQAVPRAAGTVEAPVVIVQAEGRHPEESQLDGKEPVPAHVAHLKSDDPAAEDTLAEPIPTDTLAQAEQPETARTPHTVYEAVRINRPRESAEPLRTGRAEAETNESQRNEPGGVTALSDIQDSSEAEPDNSFTRREPFQNPDAITQRAKTIEDSIFKPAEDSPQETVTAVRNDSPVPAIPHQSTAAEMRQMMAAGETRGTNVPDQARMVEQVVKAIDLSQRQGTTDLTVRLDPPELGTLHIKVSMTAGQLSAEVRAADHRIHQMISANQAEIHDALRQAGIRLEQITVPGYTSASGGFSHPEHHANWEQAQPHSRGYQDSFTGRTGGSEEDSLPGVIAVSRYALLDALA